MDQGQITDSEPMSLGIKSWNDEPSGLTYAYPVIDTEQRPEISRVQVWDLTGRISHSAECCIEDLYSHTEDCRNYYSWPSVRNLLWGVAAGSILANSSLDEGFRGRYQADVRSDGLDDVSAFWRTLGEGQIFIPAYVGVGLVGAMYDDCRLGREMAGFGSRTSRAYAVGVPSMLLMQAGLGASRPGETDDESRWKPFDDNNAVSGHAYVGAVPFITAAKMTDNPFVKGSLYFCSTLTAWSRVNDDKHYLSQACLGWWMAYLACDAVQATESPHDERLTLVPVSSPEMVGVGMVFRR
jgi:hypothetical protein